jgi:hypothetical protein
MFTRAKLKEGEGKLDTFNPDIGHAIRKRKMGDEELCTKYEKNFHKAFYRMSYMVEKLLQIMKREWKRRIRIKQRMML